MVVADRRLGLAALAGVAVCLLVWRVGPRVVGSRADSELDRAIAKLGSPNFMVAREGVVSLKGLGAPAVPRIIEAARAAIARGGMVSFIDPDPTIGSAAQALHELGPAIQGHVREILALEADPDIASAVTDSGPDCEPELVAALRDADPVVRINAVWAVPRFYGSKARAADVLAAVAVDSDPRVRMSLLEELHFLADSEPQARRTLADLSADADEQIARAATAILVRFYGGSEESAITRARSESTKPK